VVVEVDIVGIGVAVARNWFVLVVVEVAEEGLEMRIVDSLLERKVGTGYIAVEDRDCLQQAIEDL